MEKFRNKKLFILFLAFFAFTSIALGQTRKSVSGAEVTGTFRSYFTGKFKGNYNEVRVLAIGKGKLKLKFELTDPYIDGTGQLDARVDGAEGIAEIVGDTAVFTVTDNQSCAITIKFVKRGQIRISSSKPCSLGFDSSFDKIFTKFSSAKPKFE